MLPARDGRMELVSYSPTKEIYEYYPPIDYVRCVNETECEAKKKALSIFPAGVT